MRKIVQITKTEEKTVDLICNQCGKSLKQFFGKGEEDFNYCGLEEVFMWCGSGSCNDGLRYTFSMCEECVGKLFSTFTHPPETENYLDDFFFEVPFEFNKTRS